MVRTRTLVVFAALFTLPAFADDTPPAPAAATATPAPTKQKAKAGKKTAPKAAAGSANMVVTKDPETGELRPATAEEREKLLGRRPLASVEHKVVTLPDGTVMVELGEDDMNYAVATRNADGSISEGCVHGKEAAKKAVTPAASPAASPAPKSDR
jgi:hypothetical protein